MDKLRKLCEIWSLRRLNDNVGNEPLPPITVKVFWLSNQLLMDGLEGIEDRTLLSWNQKQSIGEWLNEIIAKKNWYQKQWKSLCSKDSIKMKWFRYFLQGRSQGKLVVFRHFHRTDAVAEAILVQEGFTVQKLSADMSMSERAQYAQKFNESTEESLCLLASIKVAGEGLSLTGSCVCVFLDLMWNPSVHAQAMARLHRTGQTQPVTVYMPVTLRTYEQEIWVRQNAKRGYMNLMYPREPPAELALSEYPPELLQWLKDNPPPSDDFGSEYE
ncbi:uncharacterized protein I303_105411 [Kwoniella dejecticola CBS 10117]|uniref:Helicase C-terminal domain-containing protein n=1 Tax=Kwoniella dejecticola CBS 10117 TaxID=1296121 RepID=A0A1A6A2J8_9TREE|nr:uncharacterized protein I303_05143 [Kwoniella dejecticola CBS 10117]OBR84286.1 hypothetical protein I303_05143 [Kwoniella dejecticola CBS 10117]